MTSCIGDAPPHSLILFLRIDAMEGGDSWLVDCSRQCIELCIE